MRLKDMWLFPVIPIAIAGYLLPTLPGLMCLIMNGGFILAWAVEEL